MTTPREVPRRRRWISKTATGVQLAGVLVLAGGFALVRPWAGLVTLGIGLVAVGVALELS